MSGMENTGGQQQRYPPTGGTPIMAPPSPAPPTHPGYYSHHPYQQQHYPTTPTTTTQQPYYPPYYSHHTPTQQQQHYQQQQQWTSHHQQQGGYYAQQQQGLQGVVVQQQGAYPAPSHSPYPPYQQQQQQHSPVPSQPQPQQQQQQQQQHALMNLSQFVSRQSPCPSPGVGHGHGPTSPQPSPHSYSQGPLSPRLPSSSPNLQQQQLLLPHPHLTQISTNAIQGGMGHLAPPALQGLPPPAPSASLNQIPSLAEISGSNNGGGSGSSSPSSRPLSSPPVVPPCSSNNGQMIPVRLQNMQKGARTKASMRKLMQEQQNSQQGQVQGPPSSDTESVAGDKSQPPPSSSSSPTKKSPKKGKKDKAHSTPESTSTDSNSTEPPKDNGRELQSAGKAVEESAEDFRPGYTKHGKKIGRPPKPKPPPLLDQQPNISNEPKKKGRKRKTSLDSSPNKEAAIEKVKSPTPSKIDQPSPQIEKADKEDSKEAQVEMEVLKESSPPLKKGGKGKRSSGKGDEQEFGLIETTEESESEYASSEGFQSPKTRPKRTRASNKASTEEIKTRQTPRRERPSRASRVASQSPSSSTSPPKHKTKEQVSSDKSSTDFNGRKKSPRLKKDSTSPSPIRGRQVKDKSPPVTLSNRRETRSSKDRDDIPTPTRMSRVRGAVKYSTSPSSTSPSPKTRSPKQVQGETTPVRVSSSRLAKERSVNALKTTKAIEEKESPTPKALKSGGKKGRRTSSKETESPPLVVSRARKSRKGKESDGDLKSDEEAGSRVEEKLEKEVKATPPKNRRGKGSKGKEDAESSSETLPPQSEKGEEKCSGDESFSDTALHNLGTSLSDLNSTTPQSISSPFPIPEKLKEGASRRVSISEGRRHIKSPRQGPDFNDLLQHTNPIVLIPPLPSYNTISKDTQRLSELKAVEVQSSTSIPSSEKTEATENTLSQGETKERIPPSITPTPDPAAVVKPKKVRKPKIRKGSKSETESQSSSTSADRKQSKIEKQMEFQQRKANLEVEVAQVLLEMKNSSKSPSPVKFLEAVPFVVSPPPLPLPAKPRKRKSTSSVTDSIPSEAPASGLLREAYPTPPAQGNGSKPPKKKKQRLSTDLSSSPTILAVPLVNGAPGNSSFGSSVSFQNSPVKSAGPVKVAKTAIIPQCEKDGVMKGAADGLATIIANVLSLNSSEDKEVKSSKKKKTIVPKALTPTAVPETGVRTKRKYTRKSETKGSKQQMDNQKPEVVGELNVNLIPSPLLLPDDLSKGVIQTGPKLSTATGTGKKARKSSIPKVQKPEPFQLNPKGMRVPTVFVKSPPLATPNINGATAGNSTENKERTRIGPSLKVIRGRTKFYRGPEEEELDPEPPLPKQRGGLDFDPEVPWLCCFCSLGPHVQKLGDLFGPYYTDVRKGKLTSKRETWMHQDCALWAGNVVLIGTKLHGLEETLGHSNEDSCTTCGKKGATIGCLKRGCKQAVHFPCAIRKSWKLEEETFHSYCPAHIA